MWWNLDERINATAERMIREHETYARAVYDENSRRRRRSTGSPEVLPVRRPETWGLDRGFNPYEVRARRVAIAHSVSRSLRRGTYEPRPPAGFKVPKPSGGERVVSQFQIADEVVSNFLLRSLTRKNLPKISSRAYAYRPDLGPHDAIDYVRTEFLREHRLFVAEYDFSKFFDLVNHDFLLQALDEMHITRTPLEHRLIEAFLRAPEPYLSEEERSAGRAARTRGIPQGTSLSLFLANVAASELDRALDRLGVGFARYADDTLIWSKDYANISAAASALHEASRAIGSPINAEKSLGIRLLTREETIHVEMASTKSVEFLGHSLALRSVRMKSASVRRIKSKINHLIYTNLILEPTRGTQDMSRLTSLDRDYVTLIWQLRRYLYGSLTESDVRNLERAEVPPMSFEGVMSFFPLVDDESQLADLDAWISSRVWLALRKRARLLKSPASTASLPAPHGLPLGQLITYRTRSGRSGAPIDLRLPSVRRIAKVIRLAVQAHGLRVVAGGAPLYLYEEAE